MPRASFQEFIRKLPTPELFYFKALHEAYKTQPYSVLRLPYRVELDQILAIMQEKGYKKDLRHLWLDLYKCQCMPGWVESGKKLPTAPTPNCLKHMQRPLKKELKEHLLPLYFQQNLSVNRLPYTKEFEELFWKSQDFLRLRMKGGLDREAFFLFLKNMGRERKGRGSRLGKRTADRQARFRGEGFGL